jgi:hypothetical protein
LGHRKVQEDMGVMVLAESRRRTCGSSEAQRTWCADRSRTAVTRVEAGDAYGVRYSRAGLLVWTLKPSVMGLRVWTSKLGRRFRGGTDGTWRHQGVRVEAKQPVRRRGGRQMKMTPGWTITLGLSGLTQLYLGTNQGLCNSPVK